MHGQLDNRHEIELAEGIGVHLRPAGLVPRVIARTIDLTLQLLIGFVINILLLLLGLVIGFEVMSGLMMVSYFLIFWFYDIVFELSKKSATPGKRYMKLRVVQISGAPTNFRSSFMRMLVYPIDIFAAGTAAMVAIVSTKHSQRLGDLAAGTLVVHHMEEDYSDHVKLPVEAVRPGLPLQREEQLAFLEFGRRHTKLSKERQSEIAASLDDYKGTSPDAITYALGVAQWLQHNEGGSV